MSVVLMLDTNAQSRRRRHRGVTLLELLTCVVVTGMLVGGLASAVRLATTSLENSTGGASTAIATGEAIDRLNAELRLATRFTERTATAVTFAIPDQTGDGAAETIRYAWAGTGLPLTRSMNGLPSPAASVLDNVQSLDFNFLTKTVAAPTQESAEQLLISYLPGGSSPSTAISKSAWAAQYFKPMLPANAVQWKITRIRLMFKQGSVNANLTLPVTNVDANLKPSGAALGTTTITWSSLPSASLDWVDVSYSTLVGLNPASGYAFQVTTSPGNGNTVATLGFDSTVSPALTNASYCSSTDQGATWSTPAANMAVFFQVYGTVTTQGP